MKIGDFKRFNDDKSIVCGPCAYFDVNMIDIDEDRIELSGPDGFVVGTISTNRFNEVKVVINGELISLTDI